MKVKTMWVLVIGLLASNLLTFGYYHKTVERNEMRIFAMRIHESVLLYKAVSGILKNDEKETIITMLSYDFDPFDNVLGDSACDIAKKINRADIIDILNKHKNPIKFPKLCE